MSALPRTKCPWCHRSVPVRRNGALREHRTEVPHRDDPAWSVPMCEGSGKQPSEGPK